jgi:murein DD-endopeptidase MepM/ murein hydrolase activator NlpD
MHLPVPGGKIIGTPYQGSHSPGSGGVAANWQSDNAVDIAVPVGTPIYAVRSGVIGPNIGPFSSSNPRLAGQRLTVQWPGNAAYYAHLSKILVHPGQRVSEGQLLGYSGSAAGVAHLHFALEHGTPLDWVKGLPGRVAATVSGAAALGATAGGDPLGDTTGTSSGGADLSAAQAAGCATTLALILCTVGAAVGMFYATGAPWPF